jgi:hypothetical protein
VREGEREKTQGGKKTQKKIICRFRVLNPKKKNKNKKYRVLRLTVLFHNM